MCLLYHDIEYACQRSQPPYATARPLASKGSFLEAFLLPSRPPLAHTKELARHERIFPGDRVIDLFRVCLPSLPSHLLTVASLHSPFLSYRTRPPQKPDWARRARVFYPPRLEWIATILAHLAVFAQMRRILNALAALCEYLASSNCLFTRQRGRL